MIAHFTGLRIAGFKSFADAVSIDILPGLTGIVGPNGCGKSNVVEALRWTMGETSAKSLRGGGMDDVIFAGTSARASRNLAEVMVTLEKGDTTLPAPYENEAELQVIRRIERGCGSTFKANGQEIRARDAQTLFADLATGARSSGMVSQGKVAALVSAAPLDRRHVLEEAANITGLRARRHEADLKLRATEANLARVADARAQMEGNRESLRKQAKQAARYRNISGLVRAAETEHLAILHAIAEADLTKAAAVLAEATADVETTTAAAIAAAAEVEAAEAAVAGPRAEEARLRSVLERRRVEAETLAADVAHAADAIESARGRLTALEEDITGARAYEAEQGGALSRLRAEVEELAVALVSAPDRLDAAAAARESTAMALAAVQRDADEAVTASALAAAAARQAAMEHERALKAAAVAREAHEEASARLEAAQAALIAPQSISEAAALVVEAEQQLVSARSAFAEAETLRSTAVTRASAARAEVSRVAKERDAANSTLEAARNRCQRSEDAAGRHSAELQAAQAGRVGNQAIDAARTEVAAIEARFEAAQAELVDAEASAARAADALAVRTRSEAALEASVARLSRLTTERQAISQRLGIAKASLVAQPALDAADAAETAAASGLATAETAITAAEAGRNDADNELAAAREDLSASTAEVARIGAELAGLAALSEDEAADGLARHLRIPPGLEAAVAIALGEAASASLDSDAPRRWELLPPLAPCSSKPVTLADLVEFPPELARAMSAVLLVEDAVAGADIQRILSPGEIAVTRAGEAWRWDGYVTRTGASDPVAERLARWNRREAAEAALALARTHEAQARARASDAQAAGIAARDAESAARETRTRRESALRAARDALASLTSVAATASAACAELEEAAARCDLEVQAALQAVEADRMAMVTSAMAGDDDAAAATGRLEAARNARRETRTAMDSARDSLGKLIVRDAECEALLATVMSRLATSDTEVAAARQALGETETALATVMTLVANAEAASAAASDQERLALAAEAEALARRDAAEALRDSRRADVARLEEQSVQAENRKNWATTQAAERHQALLAADGELSAAREALLALPDAEALAVRADEARLALDAARGTASAAELEWAALRDRVSGDRERLATTKAQAEERAAALDDAGRRVNSLVGRVASARVELEGFIAAPALLQERMQRADEDLRDATGQHATAEADLQAAETRFRNATAASRDADNVKAVRNMAFARAEAGRDAAATAVRGVLERAVERLGLDAELPEAEDASPAAAEKARKKLERLTTEREEMGPVNLRAEDEMKVMEATIADIDKQTAEITTAIAKLRGAIGALNREGRERLTAVFTEINGHFNTLFTRTMGGGRAHLELVGSDDPLEAGLEIYAEPPGKKLASLSLLSGGEQALTALSLIFAIFLCTPAPVAVLDEVDAPLDDANVTRLCNLLEEVCKETGTRFLVVTHHQVTMSRMNRLYGVTMQERGVSKVLSVDLGAAERMAAK